MFFSKACLEAFDLLILIRCTITHSQKVVPFNSSTSTCKKFRAQTAIDSRITSKRAIRLLNHRLILSFQTKYAITSHGSAVSKFLAGYNADRKLQNSNSKAVLCFEYRKLFRATLNLFTRLAISLSSQRLFHPRLS